MGTAKGAFKKGGSNSGMNKVIKKDKKEQAFMKQFQMPSTGKKMLVKQVSNTGKKLFMRKFQMPNTGKKPFVKHFQTPNAGKGKSQGKGKFQGKTQPQGKGQFQCEVTGKTFATMQEALACEKQAKAK